MNTNHSAVCTTMPSSPKGSCRTRGRIISPMSSPFSSFSFSPQRMTTTTTIEKDAIWPTSRAIREYQLRLSDLGVSGTFTYRSLVRSEVVDHQGKEVEVWSPLPLRRGPKRSSRSSVECFEYISHLNDGMPIWHEDNGHEVIFRIGERDHHVDGYCPWTMTIYEYQGEAYHPSPLLFNFEKGSKGEEYDRDLSMYHSLGLLGFRVITITEREWLSVRREVTKRLKKGGGGGGSAAPSATPPAAVTRRCATVPTATSAAVSSAVSSSSAAASSSSSSSPSSSSATEYSFCQVIQTLRSVQLNQSCDCRPTDFSSRRRALVSDAVIDLSSSLAGDNLFRFYGIEETRWNELRPRITEERREIFSSKEVVARYVALCATTVGRSIEGSIASLRQFALQDVRLPFSFHPQKKTMLRSEFVLGIRIAVAFLEAILSIPIPSAWTHWRAFSIEKTYVSTLLPSRAQALAAQYDEALVSILGKTRASCHCEEWKFAKALSFTKPILERVFGFELSSAGSRGRLYELRPSPLFVRIGLAYVPNFVV
ncbi:MAG: hypothetical protein WC483_00470 [Candidatus Paceibacterota bacterium]